MAKENEDFLQANDIVPFQQSQVAAGTTTADGKQNNKMNKIVPIDHHAVQPVNEESKVGKKLSDLTTRRVIILVLAMLFSVPLFSTSTYLDPYNSYVFGLKMLSYYNPGTEGFNEVLKYYVQTEASLSTPLISVLAMGVTWGSSVLVRIKFYLF